LFSQAPDPLTLRHKNGPQFRQFIEGEHAALAILALAWVDTQPTILEVHVTPLARD